jgi:hypothetical protein
MLMLTALDQVEDASWARTVAPMITCHAVRAGRSARPIARLQMVAALRER